MADPKHTNTPRAGETQADADKRVNDEANRNRQNERPSPQPAKPAPKE